MICSQCKSDLDKDQFHKNGLGETGKPRYRSQCNVCRNSMQKWNVLQLRREMFKAYGGAKCKHCGDSTERSLHVDHIEGGGNKHRIALFGHNKGGYRFWVWLKRNKWPPGYRILCGKCNKQHSLWRRNGRPTEGTDSETGTAPAGA